MKKLKAQVDHAESAQEGTRRYVRDGVLPQADLLKAEADVARLKAEHYSAARVLKGLPEE